jgi:Na+-transporting NADH:ubiquinone oxidoreductase subunit C
MQQYSTTYIFGFAAGICLVCSIMVSFAAVGLRERQDENRLLDRKKSVLQASQIIQPGEAVSGDEIRKRFETVQPFIIELESGEVLDDVDPATFNLEDVPTKPAPPNFAQVKEIPEQTLVYQVMKDGKPDMLILPIEGKGLWSTMLGFLALDADTTTVRGITYYQHGETPGLGGEVDNPRWKGRWPGRRVFSDDWAVKLQVIKGPAGSPDADPYHVDGLSGATITSRGVTNMLQFWLGENGYGPFLKHFRESRSA